MRKHDYNFFKGIIMFAKLLSRMRIVAEIIGVIASVLMGVHAIIESAFNNRAKAASATA